TPEEIHFHEVGALDAVADVVSAAAALHDLGIDDVRCGPLRCGSGMVDTEHGRLPVPAPATLELLSGFDLRLQEGEGELVTPTGAAIVAALAKPGAPAHLRPVATGYGAGTRDGGAIPNCLRAVVARSPGSGGEAWELAANVDDQTAEVLARTVDRLLSAGALDAWTQPLGMKKGRPATLLGALVPEEALSEVEDLLFREAGTLGVRRHRVARSTLDRDSEEVETSYGTVSVKVGLRGGEALVASPEYEDCLARAEEHGVAVREVMEAARAAWRARRG
ncbi:MAG: nickel pincer cofactor biosynthesis protein LarC, partial [Planctomycetota bacterium]